MVTPTESGGETLPCDYCSDQIAVLFCRADSAKLCLFCDQHVHSANALSRKHVRSQICDNCCSEPVSFRCSTDNLVLCQDCDWDAHGSCSVSAAHERSPVDGFSGCPSPLELASAWGLDFEQKKPNFVRSVQNWGFQDQDADPWIIKGSGTETAAFQDLMVPNENALMNCGEMFKRQRNWSCGKQKLVILRQLTELMKRHLLDGGDGEGSGGGDDLVTGTPNQSGWQDNTEVGETGIGEVVNQSVVQQQEPSFTALLMLQTQVDRKERVLEDEMLWNTNRNDEGTQVLFLNYVFL